MNCHQMDAILDDHAVRSLGAARRSEVDAHLATCARCSNAWLGHRVLAADSPGEPRPELLGEIAAYVVADRPVTATRGFASWAGMAAAVLVVAMLVVLASSDPFRYGVLPETADAGRGLVGRAANDAAAVPKEALPIVAGRDYRVLPAPVPTLSGASKIEVAEFFMFDCPPCFSFEPTLEAWRLRQPGYVELVRVPAMFKPTAMLHARAFYTAEALGKLDEMRGSFYEEIHVRGNPLATEAAVKTLFGRFGVDGKTFDEAFDSPDVQAKLQHAVQLNRQYGVTATPSMGVNGRYATDPSMAASHDLLDVVDALVQVELRESCRGRDASVCLGL
jgi:protein dithiol oxidoreductase (disulfide-forming)